MLPIYELEKSILYHEKLTLKICGRVVTFDMTQPHERRYVLWLLFDLQYPQADIDRVLFRTFLRKGDICLDIGANIGITSLEMLACGARKVIAFEPVHDLASRLKTLSAMDLEVHAIALSNRVGTDEILLSQMHNQGHTLMPRHAELFRSIFGDTLLREIVKSSTLDTFFPESAGDIWKVDVEGAEHALFSGATRLLSEAPPRMIFCECYDGVLSLLDILGSDWVVRRALLKKDSTELVLSDINSKPDPQVFASIAPTYCFFRYGTENIPV